MLKVARKRKRKERKKEEKRTNSIARIRARASPPAVSFACLKLHNPGGGGDSAYERGGDARCLV